MMDAMATFLVIAVPLWWFASALTGGIIATDRYLNGVRFFLVGLFFLGPLAVLAALLAKPDQDHRSWFLNMRGTRN